MVKNLMWYLVAATNSVSHHSHFFFFFAEFLGNDADALSAGAFVLFLPLNILFSSSLLTIRCGLF